ncbi:FUSC family protein [Caldibacillus lycopersici]|uniref:FUSC family protein n=1 Tax=Perspicuibacillus lycopersici TaxID=1325689 RepID=A0AAE3ISC6_9BACI|nr:FUSC family protein [Perspicuibacillus lycopersici]MCU9612753.1 FUSC family protein [Perspicuibacillus lycopersici]
MRENQNNTTNKEQLSPNPPSIIKQAVTVNRKPFPWLKAFCAGLAASLPIIIGILLGHLDYGLLAGIGGFTYLYVFNIPYAQRAKKLFFVILGLTLVTILGTLLAPYPLMTAFFMGIIGAIALFIFGALKIIGPSAIFFVLVFALTTGMPVAPELAFVRGGLVFLGGCLSWIIAMLGWLINPHGPEIGIVRRVYFELANFTDSVGTDNYQQARHRVMSVLNEADETLAAGYIPWRVTNQFSRLFVLKTHANGIFLHVMEHFKNATEHLPAEIGESLRNIANSLGEKTSNEAWKKIIQPESVQPTVALLFSKIYDADAILNEPQSKINQVIQIAKPSVTNIFMGAFDKNSIVFISAIRFGIITIIAAIIAYQLDLTRSYWVPLSCVAVLSGPTIVATLHRSIQRSFGTIIGILIASIILALNPSGYIIALFILLLTFITELFIVKNYGLAAMFFTPNALLITESTIPGEFSFAYFASARLTDVLIGSAIGLIGVFLIGRQSASSRLPHVIAKTIRSQAQFIVVLFSDQGKNFQAVNSRERMKMRTNLINLKTLYDTATGEIPVNNKALDYYWPVVFSIQHLGFLLENCAENDQRPIFTDKALAQILYACETMANAVNRRRFPEKKPIPEMEAYTSIQHELQALQNTLMIKEY